MKKTTVILCLFVLLSVSSQAALYKGQRVFSKVCINCHTSGEAFIAEKAQYEWEMFMYSKSKKLIDAHLESEKFKKEEQYKKYEKYFKGRRFQKISKHLKEFLLEYAKDSGNVAACN